MPATPGIQFYDTSDIGTCNIKYLAYYFYSIQTAAFEIEIKKSLARRNTID